MKIRIPLLSGVAFLSAVVASQSTGCSANTDPFPGALMIAVQTDLVAPKDVTAVGLFISSDGRPIFSDTRDTAPNGEVHFPATIAVIADTNKPGAVVKVRAVAFTSDSKVRVLRDAFTTVPRGRTGLLHMPLLWINEGSGTGSRADAIAPSSVHVLDTSLDALSNLHSTCTDPNQTFIDGTCQDANVDSSSLPEYAEKDIFGGGHADGTGGSCYDVKACFASAVPITLHDGCTATPDGIDDPRLSFGVALKQAPSGPNASTGECLGNGVCVVPLDKDDGFTISGGAVHFAPALCKRITAGAALGIVATRACNVKTSATPSCGPASAVSSDDPVQPAGGAQEAGVIDFDSGEAGQDDAGEPDAADASQAPDAADASDASQVKDSTVPDDTGTVPPVDAGAPVDAAQFDDAGTDHSDGGVGPDFGPAIDYTIGEPGPNNLQTDGLRLYLARAQGGALEANVISFALTDLLANPTNPSFPRAVHFNPTDSVGAAAPLFDIGYSGSTAVSLFAAFQEGPPWKYLQCQLQSPGAGCLSEGPIVTNSQLNNTRAVAQTKDRFYVVNDATPLIDYYDFGTSSWSSFTVPTTYQITAIHFIRQSSTLLIGLASGEIYRCPDSPCTATNGAFYTIAPTPGQVVAFTDDGTYMYWATVGQGIFKEDAIAPIALTAGPLMTANTKSLAVDGQYIYYGDDRNFTASRIDGSTATTPTILATAQSFVVSVVSTQDHVFFGSGTTSLTGTCKRFVNPTCQ